MSERLFYCVITELGPSGNLCDNFAMRLPDEVGVGGAVYTTEFPAEAINEETVRTDLVQVKMPAFVVGELLVLNECGREVCGHGRKPSKWFIGYEVYEDVQAAIARAVAVTEASWFSKPVPPPERPPAEVQTADGAKAQSDALVERIRGMSREELLRTPLGKALAEAFGPAAAGEREKGDRP